jgi:hypothetical protein
MPWGTDQTWESSYHTNFAPLEFDSKDGRLFDLCLEDETCAGLFSAAVAKALEKIGGLDLAAKAEATATMLEPWQALEVAPRKPVDSSEIADAVAETVEFIRNRAAEAEAWLAAHPPPSGEEEGGGEGPAGGNGGEAGGGSGSNGGAADGSGSATSGAETATVSPTPTAPGPPAAVALQPRARFHGAVRLNGHTLSVRMTLSEPGWLRLDGSLRSAGSTSPKVCIGRRSAHAAGPRSASCRLTRSAWQRLRSEPLAVALQATFEGRSGGLSSSTRIFNLRR